MPTKPNNTDLPLEDETNKTLSFGGLLKFWRGVHKLSQEQLALNIDSSTRHISRLENGRVHPSKAIVERIACELSLGERDSNHLLISAGYTPFTQKVDFHAPQLKWLRKAMTLTLRSLDPYPAILMDGASNILMVNRGWVGLFQNSISTETLSAVTNHYDFLFSRQKEDNIIEGWEDTLSVILLSLQQVMILSGDYSNQPMLDRLVKSPYVPADWRQRAANIEPMASYRVQVEIDGELKRFFSVSQTVGAVGPAAYVSEPRLSINTLYPEDDNLDLSHLIEGELSHPLLMY